MTQSSDRRRAELAVIEAARVLCSQVRLRSTGAPMHADDALAEAVMALDALPLEPATKARAGGPLLTSQNAAKMVNAASDNARIVRSLANHVRGMTVEELCVHLNRKHQSISARVHELWRNGWLRHDLRDQRKTTSGREATVWKLTDEAHWQMNRAARG